MRQSTRLGNDPLTSLDGRHVLRYDDTGTAVLVDTADDEIRWRAGESGPLLLGFGGCVQVEDDSHATVWTSDVVHPDARVLVITDDGDLELLDGVGVRLLNSRTGPVELATFHGSAPVSAINDAGHLVRSGRHPRVVTRNRDGSLQVSEQVWSQTLSPQLARWLEQDGTELTWRQLPEKRGKGWYLCLVDAEGQLLWRDGNRDAPAPALPSTSYPYGGRELPPGGRLRHQSLTSPNGSHTLVHQDDGNLVLYCNAAQDAVWATDTWWAGDGWVDLTDDGDLVLRTSCGASLWRAGTTGATRLVVNDDGTMALDGTSWMVNEHAGCARAGMNAAKGATMLRGQRLQRQSLTAPDGVTVFAHRDDRRLVLFGADGTWLWDEYVWDAERSYLALDDDGMLRVRDIDGSVAMELAGPADALVVTTEGVELHRDGMPFWRNGKTIEPQRYSDWIWALMDDTAYCVTLIHDIEPVAALRRLAGDGAEIHDGTWQDMHTLAGELDAGWEDALVAAFPIGRHTLLVEDNGWQALERSDLSAGTFAVTCYRNVNAKSNFLVFRDGEVAADHSYEHGSAEPTTPEVRAALVAMGSDDPVETAFDHDLELFCRTAGVRVTVADVTGPCQYAVTLAE